MKKLLVLTLALAMIFSLAACGAQLELAPIYNMGIYEGDDVHFTVLDGSVTNCGCTYVLENLRERPLFRELPSYVYVQRWQDGNWWEIVHGLNLALNDLGTIPAGSTEEQAYSREWLYGELPKGQYRLVTRLLSSEDPTLAHKIYVAAEFEIE